ncbi:hypothetical protein [Longitalea luteola]|uniref:hypothetical protein n=1 Tax=Longitalea luteola TaxID=2812563 RepID=UPI001A95A947|nr:hypothetical protein [Longitalea luteola]
MKKRLTLLKFAILAGIACNIFITRSGRLVVTLNKPANIKDPAWPRQTSAHKLPRSSTLPGGS